MNAVHTLQPGQAILWKAQDFTDLELFRSNAVAHAYPRHSHPTYAIGVIEQGTGCNQCRGTRYYSGPGSIVVMNPGEVHGGFASDGPCSYRMLYIGERELERYLPEAHVLPHFATNLIEDQAWAARLRELHRTLERSKNPLECQSLTGSVLSGFLAFHAGRAPENRTAREHGAVKLVIGFLRAHHTRNIRIEELATLTQLNRSYLMRVFLASTGLTIHAFLTQIRIEEAKRSLCAGQAAGHVAVEVGFADQSHLIRSFRRYTGTTPTRYAARSLAFYPRKIPST